MNTLSPQIDVEDLRVVLARYLPLYRKKVPHYQALMLKSLLAVWARRHRRLLDIGGGTGVIAEAISHLMPVDTVETIDLVDRFCPGLSVRAQTYDGKTLPYEDAAFDAATLNNVLHHVPPGERVALLRDVRRVVAGPLYIKDHVTTSQIDNLRLTLLDAVGNIPFGGMIAARYLSHEEWSGLVHEAGWRIAATAGPVSYRTGLMSAAFPSRLEITFRLEHL